MNSIDVKITCDVGGTFTDVVLSGATPRPLIGKALSTPPRFVDGLLAAVGNAAEQGGLSAGDALRRCRLFVYSTTQATNAILTGRTARTALLVTAGFPDILVRREGGSMEPYEFGKPYPEPYIPRQLTFEIPERVGADGSIVQPLDVDAATEVVRGLAQLGVEAVAISLLWSTANPDHELALGELLAREAPLLDVTLSHQLNPIVREYRRTSGTAIDASLKRLMQGHLREVEEGLRASGFDGELLAATSVGGVLPLADLAAKPIFAAKSGPSLAPIAGRLFTGTLDRHDLIVADTGGTSFDISLIRDSEIVTTRETWLGGTFTGHLTGLSSVDVKSIGAGGGSIAWVDPGGLLRVGPQSAGANPGPACYGGGGEQPTVTDAALVLGYLDPERFLGGRMRLDDSAARAVIGRLGDELGISVERAAEAVMTVAAELMVDAIKEITVGQGIDPRAAGLVAGGGAAGLNIAAIARELGCRQVVVPRAAGALSAYGGQFSDIVIDEGRSTHCDSSRFDFEMVDGALDEIDAALAETSDRLRARGVTDQQVTRIVEARYAHQVWSIDVTLPFQRFEGREEVESFVELFHAQHERIFAVSEPGQRVELIHCTSRLTASPTKPGRPPWGEVADAAPPRSRQACFAGHGLLETAVRSGDSLAAGDRIEGPAVVIEPTTTIVVPPDFMLSVTATGDFLMEPS